MPQLPAFEGECWKFKFSAGSSRYTNMQTNKTNDGPSNKRDVGTTAHIIIFILISIYESL